MLICRTYNTKNVNVIIGCIYRCSSLNLNEFNNRYLNNLLNKVYKESRYMFVLSDINVDLLEYDKNTSENKFMNSLWFSSIQTYTVCFNLIK